MLRVVIRWAPAYVIVGVLLLAWAARIPPRLDSLDAASVQSVEVRFGPIPQVQTRPPIRSTDQDAIAALVEVIRSAEETRDHRWGPQGTIVIRVPLGKPLVLEILPGHQGAYYEYRYGRKIYRVARPAILEAMRKLGVED